MKTRALLAAMLLASAASFAQSADSTKVVLREGTNLSIALSPNKQTLALDLQGTLWIMPATGGVAKAITDNLGDSRQPSWAPDGKSLVFQSYRDGGWHLWTINADGTGLKQITFGIYDDREPSYSPDGQRIIFSSDRGGNYDVWEMNATTGALTQVTTHAKNDYNPAYSPDGTSIAFVSERGAKPGIFIKTGSEETEIITMSGTVAAPAWHPDGKSIVFQNTDAGYARLYQVDLATKKSSDFTLINEDAFPFRTTWLSANEALYTADGVIKKKDHAKKKLTTVPLEATVYLHRPAYARKQYDFNSSATLPAKGWMGPTVSPNGKQVAFSALGNLWVVNIGNPNPTALTNNAFVNMHPAWSPDGKQICFVSDRAGTLDLWIHDFSTGQQRPLTSLPELEETPTWSPDGKKISFFINDLNSLTTGSIPAEVDVATGEVKKIHAPITTPSQTSWSPDGTTIIMSVMVPFSSRYREGLNKILYVSRNGQPDRYLEPVKGITLAARGKNGPVWSPDGNWFVYTQAGVLWILPVDKNGDPTSPPVRITNELSEFPSWTTDSKKIFFLATDKIKSIRLTDYVVEEIPVNLTYTVAQPTGTKIIHAGRVFNGKTDGYQTNVDIIVEGNRIKQVIPHAAHGNAEVIDASAQAVIPGLFDMHAHQYESAGERLGRLWLSYGITSVRDPGSDPYDALLRKETWTSGIRPGPRYFFTGALQDGRRIYYNIANPSNGAYSELELNRTEALGFDLIKTYVRLPDYLQKRYTQFAHAHGMQVSSHEIYPSTSYGVDQIEHIGATSRRGYSPVRSNLGISYQDVLELITKSSIRITPTSALYGGFNWLTYKDSTLWDNVQYARLYPEGFRKSYRAAVRGLQKNMGPSRIMLQNFQRTVVKLVAMGNHITAGTDAPIMPYGLSLHLELQTYVDGGLKPYQALQAGSLWAAESLGLDKDLGSIEAGKLADFVIVDGDPLKNIRDAWNVKVVLKNGRPYTLKELLDGPAR